MNDQNASSRRRTGRRRPDAASRRQDNAVDSRNSQSNETPAVDPPSALPSSSTGARALTEQPTAPISSNDLATQKTLSSSQTERAAPAPAPNAPRPSSPSSSSRPPVQRLASLRGPNALGARAGGLKFQPKTNVRRTNEQRAAQELAESDRQRARARAQEPSFSSGPFPFGFGQSHPPSRGGFQSRGGTYSRGDSSIRAGSQLSGRSRGTRGRFRGGLSSWQSSRRAPDAASGPFGGPSIQLNSTPTASNQANKKKDGANASDATPRRPQGKGKGKATVVQDEDEAIKKEDEDPDIKLEAFEPSDQPPGVSIDLFVVSSDDEATNLQQISRPSAEGHAEDHSRTPSFKMKPVRLGRHEHIERGAAVGGDDANHDSTRASGRARSENNRGRGFGEGEGGDAGFHLGKFRLKDKEVEILQSQHSTAGGATDPDTMPPIKQEGGPSEDSRPQVSAEPIEIADEAIAPSASARAEVSLLDDETQASEPGKARRRRKPAYREPKLVMQTDEDREELERHESDLRALAEELGPALLSTKASGKESSNASASLPTSVDDRKTDLVYLFQLPPFLPSLRPEGAVASSTKDRQEAVLRPSALSSKPPAQTTTHAMTEEELLDEAIPDDVKAALDAKMPDESSCRPQGGAASLKATTGAVGSASGAGDAGPACDDDFEGPSLHRDGLTAVTNSNDSVAGRVGTLTVRASGASTLTWGGLEHDLNRGAAGELLQEVVVGNRAGAGADVGWAMGQISAGFVVTPSWARLFEREH